jgi:uncharacterized SAM-binding protein YcdF (DUF218 family)
MSALERISRGIGIFTVILFLLVALTPLSNIAAKTFAIAPEKRSADAIVVLATGLMHGGSLPDESMRRAIAGIELYKQGLAPLVVFSGRARPDEPEHTEAEQRSLLAQAVGMPAEAILKEETANTTREEAVRISRLLVHRGLRKIVLVTDSLHLRRAKLAFESTGLEVFPSPSDDYPSSAVSSSDRLWLLSRIVEESVALTYYRLAGYF